jgi:8-oxo-dGTP pyrophosphatase MutT (NUDIX family)
MWWWFGQRQLIQAMSWPAILVKLIKYVSLVGTVAAGYVNANGILHALDAANRGSGTLSAVLMSAKGTIFTFLATALAVYIDHKSSKYSKLGSDNFQDKHIWKDIYVSLDQDAKKHGCRVVEFEGMAGWTNPTLNKRLLLNSGPTASPLKYRANQTPWFAYDRHDLARKSSGAKLRRYVIETAMSEKRVIFNAEKVRLCADIDISLSEVVELQRTDYISSLMTDGVAFKNIYLKADHVTISDGYSSFLEQVDGSWRLKPLASCRSSNQLGATTLAFSSDGFLVLIDQTQHNRHSAGKISPSGSGSFDWAEVDNSRDDNFFDLVKMAAARELLEETGLDAIADFDRDSLVRGRMIILGFTRLIHRGGKPEFFCVARLPQTMDSIRAVRPQFREGWYSDKSFPHDASAIDFKGSLKAELQRVCRHYSDTTRLFSDPERIRRYRLSYQLMHGLALLEASSCDSESLAALRSVLV